MRLLCVTAATPALGYLLGVPGVTLDGAASSMSARSCACCHTSDTCMRRASHFIGEYSKHSAQHAQSQDITRAHAPNCVAASSVRQARCSARCGRSDIINTLNKRVSAKKHSDVFAHFDVLSILCKVFQHERAQIVTKLESICATTLRNNAYNVVRHAWRETRVTTDA
jgi:hypothetical protein